MASISYRDHFLSYYRNEMEMYNQKDCERDLSLMEKWLSEDPKTSSPKYNRQEYFVHTNLFMSGALSNSFFSKPEHAEIRAHALARLSSIRERFTTLIKENKVNREELNGLSVNFQQLLQCREILTKKLNHADTQISDKDIEAQRDELDEIGMKIANLVERIIFLETAMS